MPSSDRRHVLISVLKDESGANAVEYALIMALAAAFIIGGLLTLSPAIREPLTDTSVCLADPANCADIVLAGGIDEQGGESGSDDGGSSLSGLADETNPGAGGGRANSPNTGQNNPGAGGGSANSPNAGQNNPGVGSATANSPNAGQNNPAGQGGGKAKVKGGGKGKGKGGKGKGKGGKGKGKGGGQGLAQGGGQGGG